MMLCDPTDLLNLTTIIFVDTKIPAVLWSVVQFFTSASRSDQFTIYVHNIYSSLTSAILFSPSPFTYNFLCWRWTKMSFSPTANHAVTFFNILNLNLTSKKNHLFTTHSVRTNLFWMNLVSLFAPWKCMLLKYCEGQRSFVALPPRTNHVVAVIPLAKEEI